MRTVMLVIHFLGLAMGVGTGIGFIFLGRATAKMTREEALKFTLNAMAMSRMGTIGLILLILSGSYLIIPWWPNLPHMPFLITKLCLVVVLIILLSIIGYFAGKAKKGDPVPNLKKVRMLSPFSLLTAITIIVMAVLSFH